MRGLPIALLFATALAAAPVPRDQPAVGFGSSGILIADDLKQVRFQSKPARSAEELKELKLRPGERLEDYDVAVHVPRTRIPHGEPIPAYFVVKNLTQSKLGLKMLVDFTDATTRLRGETRFTVKCLTPGVEAGAGLLHCTHCSDAPLAEIPAGGYWVSHGDLARLGSEPLPPGDYQVDWTCQFRAAEPVRFTVLPGKDLTTRSKRKPVRHRFLAVEPDDAEAGRDERYTWNDFGLEAIRPEKMAAALAVGPFGKHVPDFRTLPATDDKLSVRASLRRDKDVEKLLVTLESKDPRTPVEFEDVPRLYLHIEEAEDGDHEKSARSARDQVKRADPLIKTPITIEVPFDSDRWKEAGLRDGRLAVIVTSGKLEFPRDGRVIERARLDIRSVRRNPTNLWSGIVRSEFLPLNSR